MEKKWIYLLIAIGVYYISIYFIFYIAVLTRKNYTTIKLEDKGKNGDISKTEEYSGKWIDKTMYRITDEVSAKLIIVSQPSESDDSGVWASVEDGCTDYQYENNDPIINPDDEEPIIFLVNAGDCNYEDKIETAKRYMNDDTGNPAGLIIIDVVSDQIIDKSLSDNSPTNILGSGSKMFVMN